MELTYKQLQGIARGAVRAELENGRVCLSRLTAEQEALFVARDEFLGTRARASAGIRLEFITDSTTLSLITHTEKGSATTRFAYDVFVNGQLATVWKGDQAEDGCFCGSCNLGSGNKEIQIYFPWSVRTEIISLKLDPNSVVKPRQPRSKKMLMFGDSITQGAVATHPSRTYTSQLSDALDAEAFNKAIAGDIFYAPYAELAEEGDFDYITVAYGTNDWKKTTRDSFVQNCTSFYHTLSKKYPRAKIFAITPIWRVDPDRITEVGSFFFIRDTIAQVTEKLANVTLVDGFDFLPKDPRYFGDGRLHPNDEGFDFYADALIREIKNHL